MIEHTPGPWYWHEENLWNPAKKKVVLRGRDDVSLADAELIAAAPEMYRLLKEWSQVLVSYPGSEEIDQLIEKIEGNP